MTFPAPKDLPEAARDAALQLIVPDAILRQVISRPIDQFGEITVYRVSSNAESSELAKHPNVTVAKDSSHIQSLLSGPAGPLILVPAMLSQNLSTLSALVPPGVSGKALLLEQA